MSTTEDRRSLEASIRREADRLGWTVYLVGGTVRDRLRRRAPRDIDVAVEGDAVALAVEWARRRGAEAVTAAAFGTASVTIGRGMRPLRIDFSSARGETYRHPGALPDVFPAGIEADLARRDFTVNAMAVPLNGPAAGSLVDPYGGKSDLARRVVRMLHPRSPHDDPTRAYRAVRFALRLGFRIEPGTRAWIEAARDAGAFARVSGDRLRRELLLLLGEVPPAAAAAALSRLGLDRAIDPALTASAATRRRLSPLGRGALSARGESAGWTALLLWLIDGAREDRRRVADRLGLAGSRRDEWLRAPADRSAARDLLAARAPASALAALARDWSPEELLAIAASFPPAPRRKLLEARRRGAALKLSIRGEDLKRSGLAPGPVIGRALERTWRARVDGRIGRADELAFALREGTR
jgi:tRNA nucleotidyltransferase (CCA-adding enzyme)